MKFSVARSAFLSAAIAALGAASAANGQMVISQVYGFGGGYLAGNYVEIPPQGGVGIPAGDFVELFNPTNAAIDLTGWSVQWAGPTGTAWAKYDFPASTIVQPQKYLMIKVDLPAANGGLDTQPDLVATLMVPGTQDSNNRLTTGGRVALMSNTTILASACPLTDATPGVVDFFGYNGAVCSLGTAAPAGSHAFLAANTFQRLNSGCQNTQNNAADFTTGPFVQRNGSSPALNQTIFITPTTSPSSTTNGFTIGNSITFNANLSVGGCTPGALTGASATIDLTNLGGPAGQAMNIVGSTASYAFIVPNTVTAGAKTITINATDTNGRLGSNTISVAVNTALPTPTQDFGTASGNTWSNTSGSLVYASGDVKWFKVTLPAVSNTGGTQAYFDVDLEGSSFDDGGLASLDGYLVLYNATGLIMAQDDDDGSDILPQLSFGGGSRPPVGNGSAYNGRDGNLTAGIYYIAAFHWDAAQTVDLGFRVDATTGATGTLICNARYGLLNPAAPPASFVDMGVIPPSGAFVTANSSISAAGQVKWFKFEIATAVAAAARTYLDLDTETSTLAITAIGLYLVADGALVAEDRDSGSDTLSRITFGRGGRHPVGNGVAYDGSDGATLAAGQYYVAACENPGAFANGWSAVSTGTATTGNIVLRVRTGVQLRPNEAGSDTINLGTVANLAGPITSASVPCGQADVVWFKFTTLQDTNAADKYLDLDMGGTSLPDDGFGVNDTMISLYRADGTVRTTTDDDTGRLSALSYGQTTPTRPYTDVAAGDGRDGQLVAGVYYLAVSGYQLTAGADFAATTDFGTPGGTVVVNINSNLGGTVSCNAADVAGLGGSIGPDGSLTADDVVVYLAAFFSNNLAVADIAVLGGAPGQDGQLTADDIVYFLGQFFSPCN